MTADRIRCQIVPGGLSGVSGSAMVRNLFVWRLPHYRGQLPDEPIADKPKVQNPQVCLGGSESIGFFSWC